MWSAKKQSRVKCRHSICSNGKSKDFKTSTSAYEFYHGWTGMMFACAEKHRIVFHCHWMFYASDLMRSLTVYYSITVVYAEQVFDRIHVICYWQELWINFIYIIMENWRGPCLSCRCVPWDRWETCVRFRPFIRDLAPISVWYLSIAMIFGERCWESAGLLDNSCVQRVRLGSPTLLYFWTRSSSTPSPSSAVSPYALLCGSVLKRSILLDKRAQYAT